MSQHRVLQHRDYMRSAGELPPGVRNKAEWAMLQLGARGRTPSTKSTVGHKMHWRRSPVQGSHFYLWWIPASDAKIELNGAVAGEPAILVHSIRHHDATNETIEVGDPSDYAPVDLGLLDPRFDEQREASAHADSSAVAFSAIEGTPGSGKSVALLLLARDLATRPGFDRIRYITWSSRLKSEAKELFASLGEELARHITVLTLNEVAKQLVDDKSLNLATFDGGLSDQRAFVDELAHRNPRELGNWRPYPDTFYTELRAHMIGRDFPEGYLVPKHRDAALRRSGGVVDVRRYARDRGLDQRSAEIAVTEGARLRTRFFADQMLAQRALRSVLEKGASSWLAHTDAIIVDEVQDLTLVQIALIGEMANARRRRHPERPFVLTVAGDESQIVQPTGFEWGITKNLLGEKLGVHPVRHEFRSQRRSPLALSRLVEASWSLYGTLPKELRPRAQQSVAQMEEGAKGVEEYGVVGFLPPIPGSEVAEWRTLLGALAARPGRVLVDLTGSMSGNALYESVDGASEIIFDPREIKGLERATVLVSGLQATYARVQELLVREAGDRIAQMEARRLIDHMRVALSRSTNRMVFIDERSAPVYARLGLTYGDSALAFDLEGLVALLDADEMTEVEMVDALLDEATDLDHLGRREEARKRNTRAADLAEQLRLPSLIARATEQRSDFLLADAERALETGDVAAASNHLNEIAAAVDDDTLLQRHPHYAELRQRVAAASHGEFGRLIALAEQESAVGRWEEALRHAEAAYQLAEGDEGDLRRREAGEIEKRARLWFAVELSAGREFDAAGEHVMRAALLAKRAGSADLDHILLVASEYSTERTESGDLRSALFDVLMIVGRALGMYESARIGGILTEDVAAFHTLWLDEVYSHLGTDLVLFAEWARVAERAAREIDYALVDERIWDLENRWQLFVEERGESTDTRTFEAFLAGYNGDYDQASLLWETLERWDEAIAAARSAGDLERAYALFTKKAKSSPPEHLSTAVQLVRRIQAMQGKHAGLTAAEKRTVLEELARLHTELSDSLPAETGIPDAPHTDAA